MGKSVFRIAERDTIKAEGYNKANRLVSSVYDSGFTKASQVIDRVAEKGSGLLTRVERVRIHNRDKEQCAWYARDKAGRWNKE